MTVLERIGDWLGWAEGEGMTTRDFVCFMLGVVWVIGAAWVLQ